MPEPGSSQGYNRYAYSNNNPINYTDPSGHAPSDPNDYNEWIQSVHPVKDGPIVIKKPEDLFTAVDGFTYIASGYCKSSPLPIDYDEQSANDSGNPDLERNANMIHNISATSVDLISTVISALTWVHDNTSAVDGLSTLLGKEPDIYTFSYTTTFSSAETISGQNLIAIDIENRSNQNVLFGHIDLFQTTNSGQSSSSSILIPDIIPPHSTYVYNFAKPLKIYQFQQLTIVARFRTELQQCQTQSQIH